MRLALPAATLLLALMVHPAMNDPAAAQTMSSRDLLALPQPAADATIAYGPAPQQKAELRLPRGKGPHPVVVLIHGGCWEAPWGFDHVRALADALRREGYATWSLEYRRLGDPGGGWPGTLDDVALGADHLRGIAAANALDLDRVVAVGHSAGGQLALWLGGRAARPGSADRPLRLRGVVSLAGITDLAAGAAAQVCGDAIPRLLGSVPAAVPERVAAASPIRRLPLGLPQRLVCGARDAIVPIEQARGYEAAARAKGDDVSVTVVDGAGHFELVAPGSVAWAAVRDAVASLLPHRKDRP
ncbi:MAG: alpha/beta hydrolase [Vicinamibacteria bacterium]